MKGFKRENQLLSLCGLNCGLCTMLLGGHCGGCGNGNQSCRIARCSLEQGKPEYCYQCENYPCEKYEEIDRYDSFITHRRRKEDMKKAQRLGIDEYNWEQEKKRALLRYLLENYNDGRRKSFFCLAVNLLELSEIQEALNQLKANEEWASMPVEEQCRYVASALQKVASTRGIELKLRKKPK